MKTLILKYNSHEAHVPYELPDSLRFDCFVPGYGILDVTVDARAEDISVTCVETKAGECLCSTLGDHDAVLEQAGDVCAVFERALRSHDTYISVGWTTPEASSDRGLLSTIAEMALLESDLHTAWCRLPDSVTERISAYTPLCHERRDGTPNASMPSFKALESFITNVLVPRAQDLATAAAKRRQSEWAQECRQSTVEFRSAHMTDLAIDLAKEKA